MKIAVVGTGYVGLVTGTCFAETGNKVVCVDIDQTKVDKLSSGQVTIYEPGLEKIFLRNIKEERLRFITSLASVVEEAEMIFLALPTPPGADGAADLKYVLGVADELGKLIKSYKVIVNKSTVPVGTADKVRAAIAKNYKGEFDVVSNPEFLREGVAVEDFMKPDRVVIGTTSERAKKLMSELYAPYVRQGNPIIFMDERSSELTKYAANSFLAMKISFMNEIAQICERVGADVDLIRKGLGTDSRIGEKFLAAGIGVGGSCFPKDLKALINLSEEVGYDLKILKAVESVNANQRVYLVSKIKQYFGEELAGKKIAIWGLSFKPETDDIREAPSLYLIDALLKERVVITAYDPKALNNAKEILGDKIKYTDNAYTALEGADALLIATEWNEFKEADFERMDKLLSSKVIFDGRNIFKPCSMQNIGYQYISIGRRS